MNSRVAQDRPLRIPMGYYKTDTSGYHREMQVEWMRVRGIRLIPPREWAPETAHGRDVSSR